MFLPSNEFIGELPEQYERLHKEVSEVYKRHREYLAKLNEDDDKEHFDETSKFVTILKDMRDDMYGCWITTGNYYEEGGKWHREYCILAWIRGREHINGRSPVERLVIERLNAAERGIELGADADFESEITAALPRLEKGLDSEIALVDKEANGGFDYVLLQEEGEG